MLATANSSRDRDEDARPKLLYTSRCGRNSAGKRGALIKYSTSISLDGFTAGVDQGLENPIG